MLELISIETGEPLAIVDSFSDDDHRGEGEVRLLDDR